MFNRNSFRGLAIFASLVLAQPLVLQLGARRGQYGDERRHRSHFGARQDQGAGLQGCACRAPRSRRRQPERRRLQFARLHPPQDGRLRDVAFLLHEGARPAAGPQGGARISWRALSSRPAIWTRRRNSLRRLPSSARRAARNAGISKRRSRPRKPLPINELKGGRDGARPSFPEGLP